jgi:hypothetical protein
VPINAKQALYHELYLQYPRKTIFKSRINLESDSDVHFDKKEDLVIILITSSLFFQ